MKRLFAILVYWQPVLSRWFIYASLAFFTTFLDKTDKLLDFNDFNLWMWFRTILFCIVSTLLITRTFIDNSVSSHKINKVKSGDTEMLSKSDVEAIKNDLKLG